MEKQRKKNVNFENIKLDEDVLIATENFQLKTLIGKGGGGKVY